MVTYSINDELCPEKHHWTRIQETTLFTDCYYCEKCDKIYAPRIVEIPKSFFKKKFNSDRFSEIKRLAKIIEAKTRVCVQDLIKLGYLEK